MFTVCVEEAENTIVLVSDWLELDAADAWVRHDAESVRSHPWLISVSCLTCNLYFPPPWMLV